MQIKDKDKIYSADICDVYIGYYLHLKVAIKKYNICKLNEENFVKNYFYLPYRNFFAQRLIC